MRIKVKSVSKVLYGNTVTDNVSIQMQSNRIYGLCGYNGCGKTMLMRLIAGLILPTKGAIYFDDKKLGKDINFPPSMGILIENPSFLDSKSGFANLKLLASIQRNVGDDDIKEAIRRVGLNPEDKKKYKKYSLGMKQRLGIAAAIMEKPEVIILDEPTNALDKEGVKTVQEIMVEERERGALIIITCHDYSILEKNCDVIYTIEHGKIISECEPEWGSQA